MPVIEVRRGGDRFRSVSPGLDSRHSFSYGPHYDPDNLGFGLLLAHNEDRLSPGNGYDRHPHRGLDIVTWVLSGTLEHEHWTTARDGADHDPSVARERLTAGTAQVLRTGSGVHHAEHAAAELPDGVHYVQMWLTSATPTADPSYDRHDFNAALAEAATAGSWVTTVALGQADPSTGSAPLLTPPGLLLTQPGAELAVARLPAGAEIDLPAGRFIHGFIARGVVSMGATQLAAGDALRLRNLPALVLTAVEASEVLMWTLPSP